MGVSVQNNQKVLINEVKDGYKRSDGSYSIYGVVKETSCSYYMPIIVHFIMLTNQRINGSMVLWVKGVLLLLSSILTHLFVILVVDKFHLNSRLHIYLSW